MAAQRIQCAIEAFPKIPAEAVPEFFAAMEQEVVSVPSVIGCLSTACSVLCEVVVVQMLHRHTDDWAPHIPSVLLATILEFDAASKEGRDRDMERIRQPGDALRHNPWYSPKFDLVWESSVAPALIDEQAWWVRLIGETPDALPHKHVTDIMQLGLSRMQLKKHAPEVGSHGAAVQRYGVSISQRADVNVCVHLSALPMQDLHSRNMYCHTPHTKNHHGYRMRQMPGRATEMFQDFSHLGCTHR